LLFAITQRVINNNNNNITILIDNRYIRQNYILKKNLQIILRYFVFFKKKKIITIPGRVQRVFSFRSCRYFFGSIKTITKKDFANRLFAINISYPVGIYIVNYWNSLLVQVLECLLSIIPVVGSRINTNIPYLITIFYARGHILCDGVDTQVLFWPRIVLL